MEAELLLNAFGHAQTEVLNELMVSHFQYTLNKYKVWHLNLSMCLHKHHYETCHLCDIFTRLKAKKHNPFISLACELDDFLFYLSYFRCFVSGEVFEQVQCLQCDLCGL